MSRLRLLSAHRQLALQKTWPDLLPRLVRAGLSSADAAAVAFNTTLLFYALAPRRGLRRPADVLRRFTLRKIAVLCEQYADLAQCKRRLDTAQGRKNR